MYLVDHIWDEPTTKLWEIECFFNMDEWEVCQNSFMMCPLDQNFQPFVNLSMNLTINHWRYESIMSLPVLYGGI